MRMHLCIFVFIVVPYSNGQLRETEYECGRHGRFEYCIDGVPGCVIGCHCHPGYYFDTDTKICEPNIRLTQNFRRNYDVVEPTRVFLPVTPLIVEEPVTVGNKNAVDEKIDIITKDADDLGDWLYNQFFKTIENQVINETKDDSIITRRSENPPSFVEKPIRRSHKYWKARRKKKKKKKKKGLKSKLLRITEDDSLFDSSESSSTSDETSDSSDSTSSDSSGGDTVGDRRRTRKHDHGHKKIVIFNKRPRPPLPSFIFLPNMETPFFPPIGLPPPAMPMYPMVPVPPMMQFPFPAPNPAHEEGKTSTTDNVPTTTTTEASTNGNNNGNGDIHSTPIMTLTNKHAYTPDEYEIVEYSDTFSTETADPIDDATSAIPLDFLRNRSTKPPRGPRNKLAQKLRDKLKRKNKLQNYFAKAYQGATGKLPMDSNLDFFPSHLSHRQKLPKIDAEDELSSIQDVDFKYISQLIHIAGLNRTSQTPTVTLPTTPIINVNAVPMSAPGLNRRNDFHINPERIPQNFANYANFQTKNNNRNHPAYHSYNNPIYNSPDQLKLNPPYQLPYSSNRQSFNADSQLPNNANIKLPNNLSNQPSYNTLGQQTYSNPIQPLSNASFGQITNNEMNAPIRVSLNQPLRSAPYRKKIEDTNDMYYANLGRQIASMIRNVDGDQEVDIEIKANNIPNNPFPHTNGGSRSYWERSVRSPNYTINSFKIEINNLKKSNEDLFSLENKVEMAAVKDSALSLHELENIINKMQRTKSKFTKKNGKFLSTKPLKTSFNVNLLLANDLPFQYSQETYTQRIKKATKRIQKILPKRTPRKLLNFNSKNIELARNQYGQPMMTPPKEPRIASSLLRNFLFTFQESHKLVNDTTPKTFNIPNKYFTRIPVPEAPQKLKFKKPSAPLYGYTVLPLPLKQSVFRNMHLQQSFVQPTTSRTYFSQLSPMLLNQKTGNYYDEHNNNQYVYAKAFVPVKPQSFSKRVAPVGPTYVPYETRAKPSYFHHEVHHFDYFDDLI